MEETISTTVCNIIDPLPSLKPQSSVHSNHVPWAIIAASIGACALLILILRYMLHSENKRRDGEQRDETYDNVYLMQEADDGIQSEKRIDKVWITVIIPYLKILVIVTNYAIKTRLSSTSRIFRTVISATRCKLIYDLFKLGPGRTAFHVEDIQAICYFLSYLLVFCSVLFLVFLPS